MGYDVEKLPVCGTCGERLYGGSHYHCHCGSPDVTSMYGHHTTFCKVTGAQESFHHCGPGDCELHRGDDK